MAQTAGHDVLDQRAAEALHVEIIPGTEVMRDVEDVHFAHARGSDGAVYVSTNVHSALSLTSF